MALALVPLAPLVAALAIALFGRRMPKRGGWLTVLATALAALALALLPFGASARVTWLEIGRFRLDLAIGLDGLGWWMAMVVAWVALPIHVYAVRYMAGEAERARFFAWMAAFTGLMLVLVLAESLLTLFVAWEGVGVASYALIAHRRRDPDAPRAALQALFMTRVGDLAMLAGWLLVLLHLGHTDIAALLEAVRGGSLPEGLVTLVALLFLGAAIAKSAQLPLAVWLPDAMAAPTPVSALLHSATMVAAGVFLLLRLAPLYEAAGPARAVVLAFGVATALVAALIAAGLQDLKRILAWSTIAQVGEMMLAIGLGAPHAAAFHLTAHATFKPALFLAAGAVERGAGTRRLGELGGLGRAMPLTGAAFAVSALSLGGFPLLAGFWSAEALLHAARSAGPGWGALVVGLVMLSGLYIGRAAVAVLAPWRGAASPSRQRAPREPGWPMLAGMLALAAAAAGAGYALKGPIGETLGFQSGGPPGAGWRAAAVAASLLGLTAGGALTWRRGPAPLPQGLGRALAGAFRQGTGAVGIGARRLAGHVETLEAGFDRSGRGAAALAWAASERLIVAERALDKAGAALAEGTSALARGGAMAAERTLDKAGAALAEGTSALAQSTAMAEDRGVARGVDGAAGLLRLAGGALRRTQPGPIYAYAAVLLVWALVAGTISMIVWAG